MLIGTDADTDAHEAEWERPPESEASFPVNRPEWRQLAPLAPIAEFELHSLVVAAERHQQRPYAAISVRSFQT